MSDDPLSLHPDHLADLRKSGLSDETIKTAGVYSVRPADIPKILGWDSTNIQSALAFSYPGTEFVRLKVFPPYKDKKGHAVKYLQRKGSPPRLYIPPLTAKIVKDPTAPLTITEGEKKALKACQEGVPCIAIGGLWCWVEEGMPITDLDGIAWAKREVSFYPDSDVWARPELIKAIYAFAKELEGRGAKVMIPILPGGEDPKVGLDDYLIKTGREGLQKLGFIDLKDLAFKGAANWWKEWINRKDQTSPAENPLTQMTEKDRQEALALLKAKDLLLIFLRDVERLGCVGETENKVVLKLSMTSRLSKEPINIAVKGESSAGKNFLTNNVARFFPPEVVLSISSATPKSLFYLPGNLSHKIVVIAESPGAQDADYSIRTLQSEGEIVILVPEKDKMSGRIETKERRVKGPVAFVQTTTKAYLHPENETRNFDLYIDDSESQTEAIFEASNKKHLVEVDPQETERILKLWQNAHRLLEPLPVLIPYVGAIEFPTKPLRVRRDRPRFLALIEASALLHQYQRERREINGQSYVVANPDDYDIARELASKILNQVLKGATPKCEELVGKAIEFGDVEFTRAEIEARLGWDRKTVVKYLKEADRLGCIDEVTQKKGSASRYKFVKKVGQVDCFLLPRQELEERLSKVSTPEEMPLGQVK